MEEKKEDPVYSFYAILGFVPAAIGEHARIVKEALERTAILERQLAEATSNVTGKVMADLRQRCRYLEDQLRASEERVSRLEGQLAEAEARECRTFQLAERLADELLKLKPE